MCVSQLKIKIFYKYTEPVCWWLFCFECSLSQAHFICCSDPIFCSHSLLAQLHSLAVCFSLGSWDGTAGFTSESAVVEQKHRKSLKQQMLVPSSPLFFFFIPFLPLCLFQVANPLMWRKRVWKTVQKGFGNSWECAYIFTEGTDGVKPVALASALRSN